MVLTDDGTGDLLAIRGGVVLLLALFCLGARRFARRHRIVGTGSLPPGAHPQFAPLVFEHWPDPFAAPPPARNQGLIHRAVSARTPGCASLFARVLVR